MMMTEKEIKVRYKMAVFGFLWIFLNPLVSVVSRIYKLFGMFAGSIMGPDE